jgi:hypothetical protein
MKTFWDKPRELLIDGLFDAMPEPAKRLFEDAIQYFSNGNHRHAAPQIISCLNLVIIQFARSMPEIRGDFDGDEAMSILQKPSSSISSELWNRLEFIRQTYTQPEAGFKRNFAKHEVEYLIVACIDVCERMLSDDRYRSTMLN